MKDFTFRVRWQVSGPFPHVSANTFTVRSDSVAHALNKIAQSLPSMIDAVLKIV